MAQLIKESTPVNVGDLGFDPGLGRSLKRKRLAYNSMDCIAMGLQRVRNDSDFHFHHLKIVVYVLYFIIIYSDIIVFELVLHV